MYDLDAERCVLASMMLDELLEECGGNAYLAQVLNTVPNAAQGEHYAKIVKEKSSQK